MFNQKTKTLKACLIFSLGLFGCSQKPVVKVEALAAEKSGSLLQIEATLSDADWLKLQQLVTAILPRIQAVESAILWLPAGTMMLSNQTAVVIQMSASLNEQSQMLVDMTATMLEELKKTREVLQNALKALAQK